MNNEAIIEQMKINVRIVIKIQEKKNNLENTFHSFHNTRKVAYKQVIWGTEELKVFFETSLICL